MIDNGVMLGDKHSYRDYGLIMTEKNITTPVPKVKLVDVPVRNGSVDMSTVVSGSVRFEDRDINLKFYSMEKMDKWPMMISNLQNDLSGNKMQFIFDDDIAFYWIGRVNDVTMSVEGPNAYIQVKATVDPYKYSIATSAEDWLWDPFDFEQSVINETADLEVDGSLEVSIIAGKRWDNPIIISDSDMTVAFKGSTYQIKAGSQVMYDIILEEGENILTFTGNGKVTINYVGGML